MHASGAMPCLYVNMLPIAISNQTDANQRIVTGSENPQSEEKISLAERRQVKKVI